MKRLVKKRELARKRQHDRWLRRELGLPPYRFAWGIVSSRFDERSGGSSITLRFTTQADGIEQK